MLIERNTLLKGALRNKTVLLTGGGGGIGLEAAKAFAYMEAKIIIAEIDVKKGMYAEKYINELFNQAMTEFYEIDLAKENDVNQLCDYILDRYGYLDILFNNATLACMGAVDEVDITAWDKSYHVNFKAPLLLAKRFLPSMKKRDCGTIVFVSSSGASPYMGAYEVFKTSQVELSNTLAMELENTNVHTYSIGPGLVRTETAANAIEIVARRMGMSIDEFYQMNSQHILDAESAGVGFALSALNAQAYHGQEIGSVQVLLDYDLIHADNAKNEQTLPAAACTLKNDLWEKILKTFEAQYDGWLAMNIFERQWVFRDFKKNMGQSAEQVLEKLKETDNRIKMDPCSPVALDRAFFEKLKNYWKHQLKLLQGYQKDKNKLKEHSKIIEEWISDIENLLS
jgi:NAD(P)-dependent dehydrogenase (short-subunit alcohol dehydrogenase family)